jgi:hypothetical protein
MTTVTKQIRIKIRTSKRLEQKKLIPDETYDSVINRTLDKTEQNGN